MSESPESTGGRTPGNGKCQRKETEGCPRSACRSEWQQSHSRGKTESPAWSASSVAVANSTPSLSTPCLGMFPERDPFNPELWVLSYEVAGCAHCELKRCS